jgi:hypothetical protein
VSLLSVWPAAAAADTARQSFVQQLDRMMVELAPESARDARLIRQAYKQHLDLLVLDRYASLEEALFTGGLAPLPADARRFNLAPRLTGHSPIGEKDLANQISYLSARPATIGALLDIASRVKSGSVEVTSLVRHTEYQGSLRATNRNATTSVPMHTMGLAFDIALVNTPLETVHEIRDVLRQMRRAGEILFIGERKQLVFHVVPHPARLGHFTAVYTQALGAPPAADAAPVVAFSGLPPKTRARLAPSVTAEVIAVVPLGEFAAEWWAADHAHADLAIDVVSPAVAAVLPLALDVAEADPAADALAWMIVLLAGPLTLAARLRTSRPAPARLFSERDAPALS